MITLSNVIEIETTTDEEYEFISNLLKKLNIEWAIKSNKYNESLRTLIIYTEVKNLE